MERSAINLGTTASKCSEWLLLGNELSVCVDRPKNVFVSGLTSFNPELNT